MYFVERQYTVILITYSNLVIFNFYTADVTSVNAGGHAKVRGRVRRVLRHGVENASSAVSRCQTSLPASDAYLLNDARR